MAERTISSARRRDGLRVTRQVLLLASTAGLQREARSELSRGEQKRENLAMSYVCRVSVVVVALFAAVCGKEPTVAEPAIEKTAAGQEADGRADGAAVDRALATIRSSALMETVRFLASDELGGRAAGSAGHRRAAAEMVSRFSAAGLAAGGDDGFFQRFEVERNEIGSPARFELVAGGTAAANSAAAARPKPYRLGVDYYFRGFTGSGRVTAPVAFVGYGLSLPERGYDDYAGIDVTGKVVVALKPAPEWKLGEAGWQEQWLPRFKADVAADHGAVGLILVASAKNWEPRAIASVLHGPGKQLPDFPQLEVDPAVADDLLAGSGSTIAELHARIDEQRKPVSLALPARVAIDVSATYEAAAETPNVIAVLAGEDPSLREECVVVGAHLDHVGRQGDVVLPGANDNASGAAVVMAVAEAFAAARIRTRRTVVFVLFSAEEQGLNGSRYYVAHPRCPLASTVAMINADCVGFGDAIKVGGRETYPRLWAVARKRDDEVTRRMVDESWPGGGADAQPFHEAGIPTAYFATKNSYAHLHDASDTPETLDPALLESVARLVFLTVNEVAQGRYQREEPSAEP